MDFRLLGGLAVHDHEGKAVDLGSPKQRAVLAVLLLEAGRVVATDRLVELLWGDDAPKAMSSLQAYVSHLRRVLEPDRRPRSEASVLITQPPGYRLVVDRAAVDVLRFEDLVAEGRALLRTGRPRAALDPLDRALDLWVGPPLPELAAEPFAVEATSRIAGVRTAALEAAAEARLALGDPTAAVALLEPEAAAHPLQEHSHALLSLALYRAGRQADALRVVDRCRRALADAVGLDPGPELRQLEADLLAQAAALDWQPAEGQEPEPAPEHAPPAEPERGPAPGAGRTGADVAPRGPVSGLVGRTTELRTLTAAASAAAAGRGSVAVVVGEPGIGKTRLVEELVSIAAAEGVATAWGRCPEGGAMPPFWPAVQLRDELLDAGEFTAELVAPPDLNDDHAGAQARFQLQQAVFDALEQAPHPLLLVVDDLHWADPDSLRLLTDVAFALPRTKALVVVTTRPIDDRSSDALVDCLAELTRVPGATHLRLEGLDAEAVADWMVNRTATPVSAAVASAVHDRTGGNPLFVKELTDLLAAEGRLSDPDALTSARAIPPGIQFVVRRRVARLPAPTQQLLSVASVVGRAFDLAVVAAAADRDLADALDDLAPALDADLLDEQDGRFRFSHALIADALAEEVNAARRARIHAVAARTLAAGRVELGMDASVIAHHALQGMLAGTGDLAIDASIAAAQLSTARHAGEDAAAHWANAVRALARCRPGDVPARIDALIAQGAALVQADLVLAAKEPVLSAVEAAEAVGDVDRMVRASMLLNHAHVWANEPYGVVDLRAVGALERTLAAMDQTDLRRRAEVLGALASELVFAEPERHRPVCEEAEAVARASGDPLTLARVLIDVVLPLSPADAPRIRNRCEEILDLVTRHGLPSEVAFVAELRLAHFALEHADVNGALRRVERCHAINQALGGLRFRGQIAWFEAGIIAAQGRYDAARKLGRTATEIHQRGRKYDVDTLSMALELMILCDLGGVEELFGHVTTTAIESSYTRTMGEASAAIMVEAGLLDGATALVAPFPPGSPIIDDWTFLTTATAALHVRVDLGDLPAVAELVDTLTPFVGRWSVAGTSAGSMGLVDLALARGHALLGQPEPARALFESAVAGHERMRTLAWLARSLVHQGRFLLTTGSDADARSGQAAMERAGDLADRHGFVYVRRRLDQT